MAAAFARQHFHLRLRFESETLSETKDSIPTIPVTELKPQKTELHREYVGNIHALRNVEYMPA